MPWTAGSSEGEGSRGCEREVGRRGGVMEGGLALVEQRSGGTAIGRLEGALGVWVGRHGGWEGGASARCWTLGLALRSPNVFTGIAF